jgi:hypothetical protein
MGLVNELQESAERDDVLTVLRKAKRVSAKLGLREISDWLDHEQNGYPPDTKVPSYREVGVTFCYNTNGYIPAGYGLLQNGIVPLPNFCPGVKVPVVDPVTTVVSWIQQMNDGQDGIYRVIDGEMGERLRNMMQCDWPEILNQISFLARLNKSQLRAIPEQIKDKVLDWACALERAGVTGDGQSFSGPEKTSAERVVFNITDSTVEQITNSGRNIKER